MRWFYFLDLKLYAWACERRPDLTVYTSDNKQYLDRWHVLPRNKWLNIYYHEMRHSDDDRALHDHRSHNISIVLSGGYWEHTGGKRLWRKPGQIIFRRAQTLHRIELPETIHGPIMSSSLFIKLPEFRRWGFQCADRWVDAEEFNAPTINGVSRASKGCG